MEELHGSDEVHSMTAAFSQIINVPYQDSNWWNAKIKNIDEKLIEKYRIYEELNGCIKMLEQLRSSVPS